MKTLRRLNIFAGLVLGSCAVVGILFLLWSLGHYSREPEDAWASALWAIPSSLLATLCFLNARALRNTTPS